MNIEMSSLYHTQSIIGTKKDQKCTTKWLFKLSIKNQIFSTLLEIIALAPWLHVSSLFCPFWLSQPGPPQRLLPQDFNTWALLPLLFPSQKKSFLLLSALALHPHFIYDILSFCLVLFMSTSGGQGLYSHERLYPTHVLLK